MQSKFNQKNNLKKIGIIGGMGPLATLDLFEWIIQLTPADIDQDHLPIIINNVPQIPDRTSFLLGLGEDPKPYLLQSALDLENNGAELLAIPCNTAHTFIDFLQNHLKKAQIVNMISQTKEYIEEHFVKTNRRPKLGLLATTGTIKTGLYQNHFRDWEIIIPSTEIQDKLIMKAIYGKKGIKSGYIRANRQLLRKAAAYLHKDGAQLIILGCTEISLALRNERNNDIQYINPVKILAKNLVKRSIN